MSVSKESNNEGVASQTDALPPGFFLPIANNWCHSMSQLVKMDFEWTIHHLLRYELNGQAVIISRPFSAEETLNCKWMLQVHISTQRRKTTIIWGSQ